ncbi:TIGR04104 family putative zinc finger protein [Paenibacillus sp. CMAA1364]
MQRCLKCRKEFKYTQVLISVLGRFKWQLITCDNCGNEYQITLFSRSIMSISITFVPIIWIIYVLQETSLTKALLWFTAWVITVLAISPFIIRYKE